MAGVQGLHSPDDFNRLARLAVATSEAARQRLHTGASGGPLESLRDLDLISNTICEIVDAAEFARNMHADPAFRSAAQKTFVALCNYIIDLNCDEKLHHAVYAMTTDAAVMSSFTDEQRYIAQLLQEEFERDGINLMKSERDQISKLKEEIGELLTTFNNNITELQGSVQLSMASLSGVSHHVIEKGTMAADGKSVTLTTDRSTLNSILLGSADAAARRDAYRAANAACAANGQVLNELMAKRHRLAQELGYQSFAHSVMFDKVASSPEEVLRFLKAMQERVSDKADEELEELRALKRATEGETAGDIQPWDTTYYMGKAKAARFHFDSNELSAYLPLDKCLQGLSAICKSLFDIELQERPLVEGEGWGEHRGAATGSVPLRKLVLTHPQEGEVATIYLDLGARPGKFSHAAHYTIRCGCAASQTARRSSSSSSTTTAAATTTTSSSSSSSDSSMQYQRPVVVLVASLSLPEVGSNGARLLSHGELDTLVHEFGHALHSALSRTEFQHASGTRAVIDWVEVPSTLMEYFAWEEQGLALLTGHYETGEPVPSELVKKLRASKHAFVGLETLQQTLYGIVDQRLFGPQSSPPVSCDEVVALAHLDVGPAVPHEWGPGAAWHYRFSHFTGYAAGYYAYLFDRVLAANIWSKWFAADPLSRVAGEKLRSSLLVHGGAKDPHLIMEDMMEGAQPNSDALLRQWGLLK